MNYLKLLKNNQAVFGSTHTEGPNALITGCLGREQVHSDDPFNKACHEGLQPKNLKRLSRLPRVQTVERPLFKHSLPML